MIQMCWFRERKCGCSTSLSRLCIGPFWWPIGDRMVKPHTRSPAYLACMILFNTWITFAIHAPLKLLSSWSHSKISFLNFLPRHLAHTRYDAVGSLLSSSRQRENVRIRENRTSGRGLYRPVQLSVNQKRSCGSPVRKFW